uniref:Aldehyde dehydrogenase 3 family member B2 n=1 Tax=Canis lupus dingo TaxID=286419 RepID=A0A8C0JLR7_CANLU
MDPLADTLRRLREAFSAGRTRSPEFRAAQLKGLGRFLQENKQLLQEALAQDLHKSVFEAETSELLMCQNEVDLALKNLHNWMKDEPVAKNLFTQLDSAFIQKEPFGLVLIIAPWNYPMNLPLVSLVGALATGNCVVLKPSELSKSTEKVLAEVLPQYLDQDPRRSPSLGRVRRLRGLLGCGRVAIGGQSNRTSAPSVRGPRPARPREQGPPSSFDDEPPPGLFCRPQVVTQMLHQTSSGIVGGNQGFIHLTLSTLLLGGVDDGIGRYHGKFSFDTFSHHRASLLSSSGLEKLNELHYPPYTAHSQKLITWVLGSHRCALL